MHTSHREIRKKIQEEKSRIGDEEFFTSEAFRGYLTDITEAATGRYARPLKVEVTADHHDRTVAYTDFSGVYINACNPITWSMPSRWLRALSIEGFLAHENGHNLFTDNKVWQAYFAKLQKGRLYPARPSGLTAVRKQYLSEITQALAEADGSIPKTLILNTAKALSNILEDAYVDARSSFEFPGTPARGIALNNVRFAETVPDITEMIQKQYYPHNIVLNMLIQYVRSGDVNNLSGYSGELMDYFSQCVPLADSCTYDPDAKSRCDAANRIIIILWPLIKHSAGFMENPEQRTEAQAESTDGAGTEKAEGDSGKDGTEAGEGGDGKRESRFEGQLPDITPNSFSGKTAAVMSEGTFSPNEEQMKSERAQIERVLAEETARIDGNGPGSASDFGQGAVTLNNGYEGGGYKHASEDMERLLEKMAEKNVHEKLEEKLSYELKCEAAAVNYGNVHRGINVTVNRMPRVRQELVDEYNRISPKLLLLSARLAANVGEIINDRRTGGKQTGMYSGKRLDRNALHRDDGRLFCSYRLPTEPVNISVALLVDESGSMGGNDRITRARATAIVIEDFCRRLGIPLMILGHTAWDTKVDLYSYTDFDSVDRNDRYRIMDMSARDCNRDGCALRFASEKLLKRDSDVKLLIIITDGQPNSIGYTRSAAEADIRSIKHEYTGKGICMAAAAIGEDREKIERIYGSSYLDITDLDRLPVLLTGLIAGNIEG